MDITYFRHLSDSRYCFSLDTSHTLIRLAVSKLCPIDKVEIIYGDPISFSHHHQSMKMEKKYEDQGYIYYETIINLFPMRLMYIFKIIKDKKEYFLCETNIYEGFNYDLSFLSAYQYVGENYNDFALEKPSWKGRVFYQIFPERFNYRKGKLDKTYVNTKWDVPNIHHGSNVFLGGDLYGIIDKLDYLSDLGITAIYLTPIHTSMSNHKYDVLDYYDVDPHFGGKVAFKELVDKAHQKGMKVVMDLVFNHCSNYHPIFMDVRQKGKESKYYNWFFINGDRPVEWPLNYLCFAKAKNMPKFNTNNPEVRKYLIDACEFWVKEYDIDALRLDVANEVSHDFCRELQSRMRSLKPDFYIIGEIWHNSIPWLRGNEFDAIMNYPLQNAIYNYALNQQRTSVSFEQDINRCLTDYFQQTQKVMFNLMDSHDTARIVTKAQSRDKALQMLTVMFAMPGSPCLYYGTEVFLEGGKDPDCRRCMPWKEIEANKCDAELNLIKQLVYLRKTNSAMKDYNLSFVHINEKPRLLCLDKTSTESSLRIIANFGENREEISELLNGTKVLFKSKFNAQTRTLEANGVIIAEK